MRDRIAESFQKRQLQNTLPLGYMKPSLFLFFLFFKMQDAERTPLAGTSRGHLNFEIEVVEKRLQAKTDTTTSVHYCTSIRLKDISS